MKKGSTYLIAGVIALLSACTAQIQTYNLNEEYATSLHYQPPAEGDTKAQDDDENSDLVGVPARNFYGGDLKRGGIWWGSKGVTLEKGEVFAFYITQIGADSTPFGATNPSIDLPTTPFGATFPPIDLVKEEVMIKVSARAQPKDSTSTTNMPVLHMQVDDVNGTQANAKRPSNKIENSTEFKDYYFDARNIYVQSDPKKKVNGAMINSLKFFITPGYEGAIFIKEIKVVPAASVVK